MRYIVLANYIASHVLYHSCDRTVFMISVIPQGIGPYMQIYRIASNKAALHRVFSKITSIFTNIATPRVGILKVLQSVLHVDKQCFCEWDHRQYDREHSYRGTMGWSDKAYWYQSTYRIDATIR